MGSELFYPHPYLFTYFIPICLSSISTIAHTDSSILTCNRFGKMQIFVKTLTGKRTDIYINHDNRIRLSEQFR
jgi:hypothetical protein